jgi:uncharacterized protein (DUF1501 family)
MNRRNFLRTLPIGVAATSIPLMTVRSRASAIISSPLLSSLTNAQAETDKVLVVIYLEGGNDGINTIVPFEDPLYQKYRKNLGFTKPEEIDMLTWKVRGDLGINPQLNPLKPLWDEGKIAMIQNVGISNPELSHFKGLDIWNSASDSDLVIASGWLGRYLESQFPDYPNTLPEDPLAITMGTLGTPLFRSESGMMDVQVPDPLTFLAAGDDASGNTPSTHGGKELEFVRDLLRVSNNYSKRFSDLFPKYAYSKVTYPSSELARDLQHVAWCIASGMKTRVYFVHQNGYDTHFNQFSKDPNYHNGHAKYLRDLGEALYPFQRDLEALGIADRVITMTYSEFGRRVQENGDWASGTDHGSAAPHFIIGTNVNGELYGHHPDLENLDANGDPSIEYEFRQYYGAVLGDWFGVDEELRTNILSPGRPHAPWDITFDVNGTKEKKHIIELKQKGVQQTMKPSIEASLYPNPAMSETTLTLRPERETETMIDIFDNTGKHFGSVARKKLSVEAHQMSIDTKLLPTGSYYIRIISGGAVQTLKLAVVR